MMNTINPYGYNKGHAFTVLGLIFGVWSGILVAFALTHGGDLAEIAPFLFFAVPFCLILIIYDFAGNLKAAKKISHMEKMRRCVRVRGEITEFSERPVFFGKELSPDKIKRNEYGHANYKAKNLGIKLKVNYEHPLTGEKKQAVSELYSWFSLHSYEKKSGKFFGDFKKCVREDFADVYVAEDGSTWVDVIKN